MPRRTPADPIADSEPWFDHADPHRSARVGVIAEIGVNHDGDPDLAARLIDAAADAGADAVKFQRFSPSRLLSRAARLAGYQAGVARDPLDLLTALTLPDGAWPELRRHARQRGIRFVVTPFSLADVEDLRPLEVDAIKIASPDAVNLPLLRQARRLGRPLLISTGTCDLDELQPAAAVAAGRDPAGPLTPSDPPPFDDPAAGSIPAAPPVRGALLQCVSAYPTPDPQAALHGISVLRQRFGVAVGYSDHTAALDTGALAVAAGACLLEKHLTHDRRAPGPDHAASVEPDGLQRYVAAARRAAQMLGPRAKACTPAERDVRDVSRQSVCTVRALPAGHVLTAEDLTVKRPGTGLPAADLDRLPGRTLAAPVDADQPLLEEQLRPADLG